MKRATDVVRAGRWPVAERVDGVTLLFDDRYRRRLRMLGDGGLDFLLDLVEPVVLHTGDGLKLAEGGFVEVKAAEEDLVEVRAGDPAILARLAWHLGNRHLPAEIESDCILIRDDHVIVDMLRGLGGVVRKVKAPFDPEGGAYGQHNHDPGHRHGKLPADAMAESLYRLLAWLSPAYPIGAFSYSHGIETAVEQGLVGDRDSLVTWLATVLQDGTGRVDGALFVAAWRAAAARDWPAFDAIAGRAAAWRSTSEMALESRQQGGSFLSITRTAWPHADLDAAHRRRDGEIALPVAVALAAAVHGIAVEQALAGYLHAFMANLISAAVRTVPLGQSDGQLALAQLEAAVQRAAAAALAVTDLDEVGSATPLLDWCSIRHETQYTRLFRS